ncbi:MAG: Flg new 2 protein, partial [Pseudomonadota bacterium]|nr:Flg new 2 protein [Pseudomonadota bacterium]
MISGIALRRDRMALWTIVAMTLALTGGMARAELVPTAWVLDLLAQVEQWQLTGPLDFLPDRGKGLNRRSVDRANPLRQMRASYVQTPIYFEPNVGQTATDVRFLARGP